MIAAEIRRLLCLTLTSSQRCNILAYDIYIYIDDYLTGQIDKKDS